MSDTGSETTAPYGAGAAKPAAPATRRVRTHHLREMKERGEKWAMLTAYDMYTAATFDEAGIPVLLVGDSASNNVYGNETTLPGHRRRADPARPGREPLGARAPWSSPTCRSAPTRAPPSRPSTPRSGS